ncbi:MAG: SDR family NAD(P)-dependent oxidoreductase, partial [Candidatus Thorarchaeota archaeon]
ENWKINVDDSFNLADYRTINAIVLMLNDLGVISETLEKPQIPSQKITSSSGEIENQIKQIISSKTGYNPGDIETNYDLEEDLGIDTVKQAEIFGEIREKWKINVDDSFNLADYRTIDAIISVVNEFLKSDQPITKDLPSISEEHLENKLIEIISEKTGYNIEDIDIKFDLEEDLGIDTVKQAEIFGVLRSHLKISEDTNIDLMGLKSIKEIINKIQEFLKIQTDQLDSQSNSTEIEKVSLDDSNQIKNVIKKFIADKTGYDVNDIEDNYDLEEDLGIDTVKQAEIFGELRVFYNLEESNEINISEIRTPNEITQFILQFVKKKSVRFEEKEESIKTEDISSEDQKGVEEEIRISQVVPSQIFTISRTKMDNKFNNSKVLIINLSHGLSNYPHLLDDFSKLGMEAEIFDILGQEDFVERLQIKNSDLPFEKNPNIVFLIVPNNTQYSLDESLAFFDSLFIIFQTLNLNSIEKLALIAPETYFGWEKGANALAASVGAFIKSINREFQTPIKIIYSLDSKQIVDEISLWDNVEEVSYKEDERYTLLKNKIEETSDSNDYSISDEDVILVTGGALGITFACIDELTNKVKPQLILLGLAPYEESLSEYLHQTPDKLEEKKKELTDLLKSKQKKVTPVMIKREWKHFLDKLDTYRNIANLRKKGLKVEYYGVDITDKEKLKNVFKQINEKLENPISVIIHGAGIEESKSFLKKNLQIAHKVVDVKVGGFLNIINNLEIQHIKYLVAFSSVAGRFGNQGQIDYAYANAFLSRLAWDYSQRNIPFLSINWTAWADIGMATQGSTLQILTQSGVVPIPPQIGVKIFSKLVLNFLKGEYIVGGNLGIFEEQLKTTEKIDKSEYPMLEAISFLPEFIIGTNTLNTDFDSYLLDHQIQQKPVFPGVMVLETFVEFYKRMFDETLNSISDVNFHTPLKIPINKSVDLEIRYNKSNKEIALFSKTYPLVLKGKPLIKEHFDAKFDVPIKNIRWEKTLIPEYIIPLLEKSEIYEIFFHGSKFQVLKEVVQLENETIIARVDIPPVSLTKNGDNFIFNP